MTTLPTARQVAEIDAFLEESTRPPQTMSGRLIFALDATASRQPSWDTACQVQAAMFDAVAGLGRLDVKLMYFRGYTECKASRWAASAQELYALMRTVSCLSGFTQIERVLDHALSETRKSKVGALVFVGDAMEERAEVLFQKAGELGQLGTPIFMLQEGDNHNVTCTFERMARLSGGAHLPFRLSAIETLKTLLGGIAVYAAAGQAALEDYARKHRGGEILQLTRQLSE